MTAPTSTGVFTVLPTLLVAVIAVATTTTAMNPELALPAFFPGACRFRKFRGHIPQTLGVDLLRLPSTCEFWTLQFRNVSGSC
ncbi:hypothetical protein [Actinoplanes utahensis]|uniref:hypothetical protein n=1 Tax=Actinoplanes utahensis TaxID=1869 RepID=UPI0012698E3A|nr:hypothetical protein [Actinoplanes utahensis]